MIRAAVVGLGWWGRTIAGELAGSNAMQVILGVDPDPVARATAEREGLACVEHFEDALVREVDAVILCSPHRFHAAQIVAAAGAGKHVFCEKPLCTTRAEAEQVLAAVAAAGVQIGVGHERRFEPAVIDLRQRVARGELGIPLLLEANFSQDKFLALAPDNWRLSATDAPVGPLSATGIHLVDLAIAMFGEPCEVWARLATHATKFANGDTLAVTLGFKNGATALITAILTTPFVGRFALFGSTGWTEIRDRTHPEKSTGWDMTTTLRGQPVQTAFWPPHPAVRDNLDAFARAASGSLQYPVSHAEMLANVRAFEAITRSALSGRVEVV